MVSLGMSVSLSKFEIVFQLQEFDEPHILLQSKTGHFYDLVNQTKGSGSEFLHRMAEEVRIFLSLVVYSVSFLLVFSGLQ